jgi:hypothetical protein
MNNEQITKSNEQLAISKVKRAKITCLAFLIALFSLLIGCDLFNSPVQHDFLEKIDEEIRWSNAAKLTVRIEYPPAWGVSNPSAGLITPSPKDIRQGYAFDLEFTPNTEYNFQIWRAYDTAALNALGNWVLDPGLLNDVPQLSGVEIPAVPARGGTGSFKINTVTPVTLVPWCGNEPYVVRTEPRNEGRSNTTGGVHPSTPVTFYFNSSLLPSMNLAFEPGIVEIKARPIGDIATDRAFETDWSGRFEEPVYESRGSEYTVTIAPKASGGPIAGYQIEVTIGPGIQNANGVPMTRAETLYYKVSEIAGLDVKIDSWSAAYNDSAGTITVNYAIGGTNAGSATPKAYYQMNQGSNQTINLVKSGNNYTGTIIGVNRMEADDAWKGGAFGNIREYRIFIELVLGANSVYDNFKIWNVPGMTVGKNATVDTSAIEIFTAADIANIPTTGLSRQYVLANDITVSSHTPIGTGSGTAAFTGKFYGNGRTIIIDRFNGNTYTGLFGYTSGNALIRDLTVVFNNTTIASNPATIRFLAGIIGQAYGNTEIRNIITGGNLSAQNLTTGTNLPTYIGGITGTFENTVTITNIYAGLNINTKADGPWDVYIGGITGDTNTGGNSNFIAISAVNVTGTFNHVQTGTGALYIGGVAGWFRSNIKVSDIEFSGNLTVKIGAGDAYAGGFFGNASNGPTIERSSASGDISCTAEKNIYAGGLIGNLGNGSLTGCYARTNVIAFGNGTVSAGGLIGNVQITSGNSSISKCYATGTVVAEATNGSNLCAGGLIGYYGGTTTITITNSYALGSVSADTTSGTGHSTYAGGLVGLFTTTASTASGISNCFAAGNVAAKSSDINSGRVYSGGLVGRIAVAGNSNSSFLKNNVAYGNQVMRMGGGDNRRYIARVFSDEAGIYSTKNYALSTMRMEANKYYTGWYFGDFWNGSGSEPESGYFYNDNPSAHQTWDKDGEHVGISQLYNPAFWTVILEFDSANWNISATVGRGYPTLIGVGGQ